MAIYQRDRDFHKIFSEISIDVVPLRFIKNITCLLEDGRQVVLDEFALREADQGEADDLENLIKTLDFYEDLSDLQIRIDYELVERDVDDRVRDLLKKAS
jgi:hypothetical protein